MQGPIAVEETQESPWIDINRFKTFENPGECVSGVMVAAGSVETAQGGRIGQFTLLDQDGFVTFNEPSQLAILRRIPSGIRVLVTYLGEEKHGTNRLRRFQVQIAREDLQKVGAILTSRSAPALQEPPVPEEYYSEG